MSDSQGGNLVDGGPRPIGSDLVVGPLGYGCWRLVNMPVPDATARIEAALDAGLTLIDTADVYGLDWGGVGFGTAEELLGQVLAATPSLRDRMVLATKGGILPPVPYDSGEAYLRSACEASLRRLQVDVIDLYQVHRPDMFTHPADLAATLTTLRDEGKVREVGVSNYTAAQHDALQAHLGFPLATVQPQLSASFLDPLRDGTLDAAMRHGTTVLAWSPLGGGSLATGEGARLQLIEVLDRLAEREDVSRVDVALAFVLAHPSRPVPIVGTITTERITASPEALRVRLDRNDVYDIIEASEGAPLP